MKKTLFILVSSMVITLSSFGQAPEGFKYQAVVRDAQNIILTNQDVGIQLAILQGSPNGSAEYTETFTPTTNEYGLITLEIGNGTSSDDFTVIVWSNGPYFLEVAIDVTGGSSYSVMGTSQLMSVPYALFSKNAEHVINDLVDDADADPTNEIQTLSQSENSIILSNGGGSVDLPGTVAFVQSKAGSGNSPTATRDFLSTQISVAITSSTQTIHFTVTQSFGSSTGAAGLDIYPGYRIDGSNSDPSVISAGIFNLTAEANQRQTFTISGVITDLSPGTYDFGMVGDDDGNGNWDNNEWGYISLMVIN